MAKFLIKRVAKLELGTFGVFLDDGLPFALTLERPWKNNKRGESCIPFGTYLCRAVRSPKFGQTFEIVGVSGRSEILFHKGNLRDDSHGCVLVGEQFEPVLGDYGIAASSHGFGEFLSRTEGLTEFMLEIIEV